MQQSLPNQEVGVHDFPILENMQKGQYIGEHVAEFHDGYAYTLVNMKSGKVVHLVDAKRNLLVTDKEIDFSSIHERLEHASYADGKNIQFWLKRISEFQDGFAAMAWTIYPEGRWSNVVFPLPGDPQTESTFPIILNHLRLRNIDFDVPDTSAQYRHPHDIPEQSA